MPDGIDDFATRRTVLCTLGGSAVAALAGCASNGGGDETTDGGGGGGDGDGTQTATVTSTPQASGTVNIGVLQPLSGPLKYYGQQSVWGFATGLAYKTGTNPISNVASEGTYTVEDNNVTYKLHVRDSKLSPRKAPKQADALLNDVGVDFLFGPTSSGIAQKIIPKARESNTPMMVGPAAQAALTADKKFCGEHIFRASENTAIDARAGGTYVAKQTDIETVAIAAVDGPFGRSVAENYTAVLENQGVTVLNPRYFQRDTTDFTSFLDSAKSRGAEGVVAGFTVQTGPAFIANALTYDMRIFGGFTTRFGSTLIGQALQKTLGKPLTAEKLQGKKLGPFTTRYHWNQYTNEVNKKFVEMYSSAYGVPPDLFTSGTFTAASAIVQGTRQSASVNGIDIANAVKGMSVTDTPKGKNKYTFQPYNNQAKCPMTVANFAPKGDGVPGQWNAPIMPSEPVAEISAGFNTIPKKSDLMGCSL